MLLWVHLHSLSEQSLTVCDVYERDLGLLTMTGAVTSSPPVNFSCLQWNIIEQKASRLMSPYGAHSHNGPLHQEQKLCNLDACVPRM